MSDLKPQDERRLRLIKADSKTLQTHHIAVPGTVGLVFVDGGHDDGLVRNDSRLASNLIGDDGVIIWHDFDSSIHGDVTQVVGEIAEGAVIVSIQHTLLAIELRGSARGLVLGNMSK